MVIISEFLGRPSQEGVRQGEIEFAHQGDNDFSRKRGESKIIFFVLALTGLAILTPNIPESDAKSRAKNPVHITLDLVHASTSGCKQSQYDRVGS